MDSRADGATAYSESCPLPADPGPSPKNLLSLPEEILMLFPMELDFKSLVRFRITCRKLNRITRTRQVWHHLLRRAVGMTIPHPFFLSKPLSDCSADDIETDLRRWESGWGSPKKIKFVKRSRAALSGWRRPRGKMVASELLPGGRWLIAGYEDGSVWYFDLSPDLIPAHRIKPALLISSSFSGVIRIQMHISIDCASDMALGSSLSHYHLEQFNLAVVACPARYGSGPTKVSVWRIHVPVGNDPESSLRLGDCLSSFTEFGIDHIDDCSLYGPMVAYSMLLQPASCIVIVSWSEANGKASHELVRRYAPVTDTPQNIYLLPSDRLLIAGLNEDLTIFDWVSSCPESTRPPQQHRTDCQRPQWVSTPVSCSVWCRPPSLMVPPHVILGDAARVLVPIPHHLHGCVVPLDKSSKIYTTTIRKGRFRHSSDYEYEGFGYHRAVCMNDQGTIAAAYYRWPDGTGVLHSPTFAPFRFAIRESDLAIPRRLLFDEFTNRVVVTDLRTSRFFFVYFSN
ncbi:hypothetical protein NMY22_g4623 [Coprinellus aureogranulatus]|nr:hypothetical protein NMY22_g4623 [Coprinellus aureogranulatus]